MGSTPPHSNTSSSKDLGLSHLLRPPNPIDVARPLNLTDGRTLPPPVGAAFAAPFPLPSPWPGKDLGTSYPGPGVSGTVHKSGRAARGTTAGLDPGDPTFGAYTSYLNPGALGFGHGSLGDPCFGTPAGDRISDDAGLRPTVATAGGSSVQIFRSRKSAPGRYTRSAAQSAREDFPNPRGPVADGNSDCRWLNSDDVLPLSPGPWSKSGRVKPNGEMPVIWLRCAPVRDAVLVAFRGPKCVECWNAGVHVLLTDAVDANGANSSSVLRGCPDVLCPGVVRGA